jgi:hypothetical protein
MHSPNELRIGAKIGGEDLKLGELCEDMVIDVVVLRRIAPNEARRFPQMRKAGILDGVQVPTENSHASLILESNEAVL